MNSQNRQTLITIFNHIARPLFLVMCLTIFFSGQHASAADVFNGKTLYQSHCETCHGSDGAGVLPGAPNFRTGKGLMQPDRSLFDVIWYGKNSMPAFQGMMEKEEIFDVIGYIRTFF